MRTGTADEVDETERLEREEATLPDIPPSRPATKELRRALQKVCRPRMQEQQSRPTVQHKGWACGCHTRGGGSRSECGLLRQVKAAPSKFQQRTAGTGRTRSYLHSSTAGRRYQGRPSPQIRVALSSKSSSLLCLTTVVPCSRESFLQVNDASRYAIRTRCRHCSTPSSARKLSHCQRICCRC